MLSRAVAGNLYGTNFVRVLAQRGLEARRHATRNSVLMWTMSIPASIAFSSPSSVPDAVSARRRMRDMFALSRKHNVPLLN
jgi:hypothetical protein